MLVEAKLTPDEFKNVHNALCDIHQIVQRLKGIQPDVARELEEAEGAIRDQFSATYAEDSRVFDERHEHYSSWGYHNHIRQSIWSIYEVADLDSDSPLLAPDQPKKIVYRSHWGKNPVVTSFDPEITHWGYLWILSEALIRTSGDRHHVYVESFKLSTYEGEPVLELITGS